MAWAAADDNPFADPSVAAAAHNSTSTPGEPPSWLRGGGGGVSQPPPPPPPVAQQSQNGAAPARAVQVRQADPANSAKVPQVILFTRITNVGLSVLLSATAVVELIGIPNFATVVLACYLFAFACILCCFETHLRVIARVIAENFGFLYNAKGRAVFLLFVGVLCFSFRSILGYISGVAMLCNAVFNFWVIWQYPEIEEQQQRKDLESSGQDFLRRNQGTIARHGVNYAQNNPDQAAAAARAAANSYV